MTTLSIFSWFENPYWLLALLFVFPTFLLQRPLGYIVKTYTTERGMSWSTRLRLRIPLFFFTLSACAIVVALADPTREYVSTQKELRVNRILVAIDKSSSMYEFVNTGPPIYCTDKNLEHVYPRIYLACKALHRLIDDTAAFAKKKGTAQKDKIGMIRFALYSRVLAYPTSNYARLHSLVDNLNWRRRIVIKNNDTLDVFTEIHEALRDLYFLALKRNKRRDGSFVHFGEGELKELARALYPSENVYTPLRLSNTLEKKLLDIKKEFTDTVFILLTDASQGQLEGRFNKEPASFKKMIDLAVFLELPIYIISSGIDNPLYKKEVRRTGFGPKNGKHRGDFLVINRGRGDPTKVMTSLVSEILESRFGRTVSVQIEQRKSYARHLAFIALTLLIFGLVSREILVRSLSDV